MTGSGDIVFGRTSFTAVNLLRDDLRIAVHNEQSRRARMRNRAEVNRRRREKYAASGRHPKK
jgi:hypothetical protein